MICDLLASVVASRCRKTRLALMGLCFGICTGCSNRNAYVPPPPPEVIVGTPIERTVTTYHEFPGTTQASQAVSITPRVLGYLDSLHFTDGSFVAKDQLLFVIDPRPYKDAVDVAVAQVDVNKAGYKDAKANNARAKKLDETPGAISKQDLDLFQAREEQAKANLELANANLANANLNLDFTHITAPIKGKISRRLVDVGNLVTANITVLTTIDQYDPMYAYFNASEADFLDYLERQRKSDEAAKLDAAKPDAAKSKTSDSKSDKAAKPDAMDASAHHTPVEMGLSDETGYPHKGTIDFADNRVDPNTGTISVRGVFPNPQPYLLAPGLFVRIRVPIGTQANALLVPDRALSTDQQGQYLLIVGPDHVVEHRAVEVGTIDDDNLRVINHGLKRGEQFIVEGLQFARPGSKVSPVSQPAKRGANEPTQQPKQTQGRPTTS
jgi:RND family efflux transporter MFP subunit